MPSVFPGLSKVSHILIPAQIRDFRGLWSYEFISKTESKVANRPVRSGHLSEVSFPLRIASISALRSSFAIGELAVIQRDRY